MSVCDDRIWHFACWGGAFGTRVVATRAGIICISDT